MAIDLLHSFAGQATNAGERTKGENTARAVRVQDNHQIARAIRALKAGQTIQGEIISVKGKDVQLSVMNQLIVDAKLDQNMNLSPGTLMAFQIKSNNTDSGLSLIPLFTNISVDPNAMKALDMAGIPLTDKTLEMVKTMMQKGLPIDKQSLQEVYRDVVAFKDSKPSDIISLRQMNLPITSENLKQYEQYSNNRHFLANTFTQIGEAIGKQLSQWIREGNPQAVRSFVEQLSTIFGKNPITEGVLREQPVGQVILSNPSAEEVGTAVLTQPQSEGKQEALPLQTAPFLPEEGVKTEADKTVITEEVLLQKEMSEGEEKPAQKISTLGDSNLTSSSGTGLEKLITDLFRTKNSADITKTFQKFWEQEIKPALLLEPEQVFEKEEIRKYYENISNKMGQLESLANKMTDSASNLSKSVQNTVSNLEFIHQMNQLHAYVQLPLKLSNREAKGELYVFTNKRSLTKQDGKVTALLHLDMEYLGKMDVYVALENQKVSTQFYLEKEEYLDFLNGHMDILTSRLNKRGYECSVNTCLRQEEQAVVETIVKDQNQTFLLSTQSFDMRA